MDALTEGTPFRLDLRAKLTRIPLFWLGLALLALIIVQGLNPAWTCQTDGKTGWMQRAASVPWLPAGVTASAERGGGPWRSLLVYASAWLTMCAIWTGFTRRRAVRILLTVIAADGLALAAFGLLQRLLANGRMFWLRKPPSDSFFASFIYKNHAGAYLNLALTTTCGLAAWHYLRDLRRMKKSRPAGLYVFFAALIALSVLVSYSRGATVLMLAFVGVTTAGFAVHQWFAPGPARRLLVAVILLVIIGLFVKTGLDSLQADRAWDHLEQGLSGGDNSLSSRQLATTAALDMYRDYWIRGAGAGSFRYLFPPTSTAIQPFGRKTGSKRSGSTRTTTSWNFRLNWARPAVTPYPSIQLAALGSKFPAIRGKP